MPEFPRLRGMLLQVIDKGFDPAVLGLLIRIPGWIVEDEMFDRQRERQAQEHRAEEILRIVAMKGLHVVLAQAIRGVIEILSRLQGRKTFVPSRSAGGRI